MSLFGSLLGGDVMDDDPFFGGHMRQMNRMMSNMNSLMQPFGGFLGPRMGSEIMPFGGQPMGGFPFGFPTMNMNLMQNMDQIPNNPHCHSYSSSTVMTMTNGPDGRPQVYQASQSVRQGPNGVKETKKAVSDTRSGVKKLAIGHHIGDRAHIVEREQNYRTGDQEERQDYINLEEEEADQFNQEWKQRARQFSSQQRAINYSRGERYEGGPRPQQQRLALPSSAPAETPKNSTSPSSKSRKRQHDSAHADKGATSTATSGHKPKTSKISD